jgi:hypothetical protein
MRTESSNRRAESVLERQRTSIHERLIEFRAGWWIDWTGEAISMHVSACMMGEVRDSEVRKLAPSNISDRDQDMPAFA